MPSKTKPTIVAPDWDPGVVKALPGWDDQTKSLAADTEVALTEAVAGLEQLSAARANAHRNPGWNEAQRAINVFELSEKVRAKIDKRIFRVRGNLDKTITSFEEQLSEPLGSKRNHPYAQEIRSHFKTLSDGERQKLIMRAINDGDTETAESVLGGHGYLSGFSDEMRGAMTRLYHEKSNPETVQRLTLCRAADDLLAKRHAALDAAIERAVGMPIAKVRALRSAKTETDKLFVLSEA